MKRMLNFLFYGGRNRLLVRLSPTRVQDEARRFLVMAVACIATLGWQTAAAWDGSSLAAANGQKVYLLNVASQKFVGQGGRWGTQALLGGADKGFTLVAADDSYQLQGQVANANVGSDDQFLTLESGTAAATGAGWLYVDRNVGDETDDKFHFEPVDGQANVYTISVAPSANTDLLGTRAYLTCAGGAVTTVSTPPTDASGQWMLVTKTERDIMLSTAEQAGQQAIDITYQLDDTGFCRNSSDLSKWHTDKTNVNYLVFGGLTNKEDMARLPEFAYASTDNPVKRYKHTYQCSSSSDTKTVTNIVDGETMKAKAPTAVWGDKTYTYASTEEDDYTEGYQFYVGNGFGADDDFDLFGNVGLTNRQLEYGAYRTANIHGDGRQAYQFIEPARKGWYKVSCNGFTTKAGSVKLRVSAGKPWYFLKPGLKYQYIDLTAIDNRPSTYMEAAQLLNGTYPDNRFTHEAWVYADETTESGKVYVETILLGIDVSGAGDDGWACFNNFHIYYYGDAQAELVLDEQQASVDYINQQRTYTDASEETHTDYDGKRNLYLNRTMNVDKWNSLVLPVSLTVGQAKRAFGTHASLSRYSGVSDSSRPGTIIFNGVSLNGDENATAVEAGQFYLVKPSSLGAFTSSTEKSVPGTESTISTYCIIPQVTFCPQADLEAAVSGDVTSAGDTNLQFAGTYVTLGDANKIPANSYVLNGNNVGGTAGLWYYRTKETASKGFRGWLQTTDGAQAKGFSYEIDGVTEAIGGDVTAIGSMAVDDLCGHGNVYTLGGQLVRRNATSLSGLAPGIYMAGGRKYVVK